MPIERPTEGVINPENNQARFKLLKDERGTFGVFQDYPNADEVLVKIAEHQPEFYGEHYEGIGGHRDKFFLTLSLSDGENREFIVKAKSSNEFADSLYPRMPSSGNMTKQGDDRQGSVLNEIIASREAANRYKAEYGKELPIEKPVGFYISSEEDHRGERWVVFEKLNEIIPPYTLDDSTQSALEHNRHRYATEVEKNLARIGIYPTNLEKDMVMVGDPKNFDSIKFVIVDSEEWKIGRPSE